MNKQIHFRGHKILSKQLVKATFTKKKKTRHKVVYVPWTQQRYRIQNLIVKLPKIIKEEVNFKLWTYNVDNTDFLMNYNTWLTTVQSGGDTLWVSELPMKAFLFDACGDRSILP